MKTGRGCSVFPLPGALPAGFPFVRFPFVRFPFVRLPFVRLPFVRRPLVRLPLVRWSSGSLRRALGGLLRQVLLLPLCLAALSCAREDIVYVSPIKTVTCKVAAVLPLSREGGDGVRLKNTVDFALENLRGAQKLLAHTEGDTVVDLDIEWYDEDVEDLGKLASDITSREDILMVIGPFRNENVDVFARACKTADLPLIVPCVSSEDIIRRYALTKSGDKAEKPFLWSLCETDVSQSEVLLVKAWEYGAKSIALLAPDDDYGKTFYEWIPFLSTELGLELSPDNTLQYTDNLEEKARKALSSDVDCVICAASSSRDAQTVLEVKKALGGAAPRILFTNGAFTPYLLELGDLAEGAEGVAPYSDPTTGFQIAYEERFGFSPAGGEAQVYDAVLLAGLTAFLKECTETSDSANGILRRITSTGGDDYLMWDELALSYLLAMLRSDSGYVKLVGASGVLRFDDQALTSLVQSTYVHWLVYDGRFLTLDYRSSDGSRRTTSTMASWNWKAKVAEDIEDVDSPVTYNELNDSYALLVQGSCGWENYRHQADVLNVYQMLRKFGWDDDHIILILSDDIAGNAKNKTPGQVRCSISGEDLYGGAVIDYSTDTLVVSDISDILLGRRSAHLPTVLDTDDRTDILVFWSGHGCVKSSRKSDGFVWRGDDIFTDSDLLGTLLEMDSGRRYRKMLLLFEPCFSRNMALQAEGFPGVLSIASAAGNESSFADFHSSELGVWMSDRFTNNLVNTLTANPGQTYRELYEYLYTHTLGSHVFVENSALFGNLCRTTAEEFIVME